MRYFAALVVLGIVIAAFGGDKNLRVICYNPDTEDYIDVSAAQFAKMESGSLPDGFICEEYDAGMESK